MAETVETVSPVQGDPLAAWRARVEKELKGRSFASLRSQTRDGVTIEPLYPARRDVAPVGGRAPGAWTIVQLLDISDPDEANRQALADVAGGATGLALEFSGNPLRSDHGIDLSLDSLPRALDGVDLANLQLRLEPHPQSADLTRWTRQLVARRGFAPERTFISFGLDPLPAMSEDSWSPDRLDDLIAAFGELRQAGFSGALIELDGRAVHETGGTEAQELAVILAAAASWLRSIEELRRSPYQALSHFGASVSADHDQFASIAKLRALRLVWKRFAELCGAPTARLRVHAETSRRMLTRAAPQTNLIRTTIAAFAAGVGGADSVAVVPHSAALSQAGAEARTLARNTHHLLLHESNLHRVIDPAAGSGAIEALTEGMAACAWQEFQAIEREGGLVEAFRTGGLMRRIAGARDRLRSAAAAGSLPLVGSTVFRNPSEPALPAFPLLPDLSLAPILVEDLARAAA